MNFVSLILIALFTSQFSQAVTLTEFDAEELSIGVPKVEIKSIGVWISPDAKKITETVYEDPGGCAGCDFIYAYANYNFVIPLTASLNVYLPSRAIFWSKRQSYTAGIRITIPPEIIAKDLLQPDVVNSVGEHALNNLNYIATVRRKIPTYNKEQRKCYLNSFRGTYSASDKIVRSYDRVQYLVGCP